MNYSLRTKLSLSYVFVALSLFALVSFLTNFLLENQFRDYIIKQQELKNKEIVNLINQQYNSENNSWDKTVIENIGVNALEQGLIVKLKDVSGKMVWDATVHNNGTCTTMLAHMAKNMSSRYPNVKGGYVEANYPVTNNFKKVGNVDIGYYGPFYLNDNDLVFINTLNNMLISVGILSLLFALIIGAYMAKRLSLPISRVTTAAQQISKGYFDGRVLEKSNTREIGQLTTTINNLAETLEMQEILRKRLTADVAHELRTPLATLQSHLEAMIDGIWKADTERLKSCHEEVIRINRLVGDLEKLARYESENLILNKSTFDISKLIQSIIKNYEIEFLNKKIEIHFSGEVENVQADKDKISQVIINLISNAFKYTPQGGSVKVSVKSDENLIKIIIKDNGPGISEEDLPYIFERFYRADKSRNRMTGGSGIGLTITKSLVEAHKGKITVISKVNEGTEFIITLPQN